MEKPAESRMLFSSPGAERLLGNGDLLFKDLGSPRRLLTHQPPALASGVFDVALPPRFAPIQNPVRIPA